MEAIGEEGKDHLSFLAACGAALWASHPKDCGVLVNPFHLLLGNMPLSTLLNICPLVSSAWHKSAPPVPHPTTPHGTWACGPIQMVTPLPQPDCIPISIRNQPKSGPWGANPLKEKGWNTSSQSVTRGSAEPFTRDSNLVCKVREEHNKTNHQHFNCVTFQDLMNIFWHMITSAGLLGSQIYEIQEFWEGWSKLQYANNALRASPKGLQFLYAVSPSESPKVMGLAGIHNPDALHHFYGMTFCPWCRKEGQNKGL